MQVHHQSLIIGKVYQYLHNAAMEKLRSQLILEDSILGYLQILTMLRLLYYFGEPVSEMVTGTAYCLSVYALEENGNISSKVYGSIYCDTNYTPPGILSL